MTFVLPLTSGRLVKSATTPLLAAALLISLGDASQAQPAGLVYPRPGVVCDSVGKTCFDSYGPSIGITADVYGKQAGDHLTRELSNTNSRDFRLSTGQACSVAKRTCWNDGWSQSRVAPGLTQQLFGGGSGGGLRPGQAQVARDTGLCSLSRGSQRVYDGPCLLKQVRQGGQNRYEVRLQNGNTGIFRFGDYKLVATQENSNRNTSTNRDAAVGNAIGNLLNALFQ